MKKVMMVEMMGAMKKTKKEMKQTMKADETNKKKKWSEASISAFLSIFQHQNI